MISQFLWVRSPCTIWLGPLLTLPHGCYKAVRWAGFSAEGSTEEEPASMFISSCLWVWESRLLTSQWEAGGCPQLLKAAPGSLKLPTVLSHVGFPSVPAYLIKPARRVPWPSLLAKESLSNVMWSQIRHPFPLPCSVGWKQVTCAVHEQEGSTRWMG